MIYFQIATYRFVTLWHIVHHLTILTQSFIEFVLFLANLHDLLYKEFKIDFGESCSDFWQLIIKRALKARTARWGQNDIKHQKVHTFWVFGRALHDVQPDKIASHWILWELLLEIRTEIEVPLQNATLMNQKTLESPDYRWFPLQ